MTRLLLSAVLILLLTLDVGAAPDPPRARGLTSVALEVADLVTEDPQNVILFLGDGMGPEHVRAASMYLGRSLVFESFPYTSLMTTDSTDGLTDSAAGATALATGRRVENEVISMAIPGNGQALTTVMEMWQARGASAGLLTTSIINDASPAAFGAHEPTRENLAEIALDYFTDSRPNVLMGGTSDGVTEALALGAGYSVVLDAEEMLGLDLGGVTHLAGLFEDGKMPPILHGREPLPSLAQMTTVALDILDDDPDGFFLLVEQEGTDSYSHGNNIELMLNAVIELEEAVEAALAWASEDGGDTLIIVTADHETGGLEIRGDNGPGELPDVSWTAGSRHTTLPVPIYALGPNAAFVTAVEDITQVASIMDPDGAPPPPPTPSPTPPPPEELEHKILLPLAKWFLGE